MSSSASLSLSGTQALLESVRLLNGSLNLQDLLSHLLRTVMGRLLVTRGAVAIEEQGGMRVALARGVPALGKGSALRAEDAASHKLDLVYPIGPAERPLGLLALGKPALGAVSAEQQQLLLALLELAATAIANARAHEETVRMNRVLDQNVQELHAILDLARGLASKLEAGEIAHLLALTLAGRWTVRKHALAAWRAGHAPVLRQRGIRLPDTAALQAAAAELAEAAYTADTLPGSVRDALSIEPGSAVFPIRSEELIGIVVCGPRMAGLSYSAADLEFGAGLIAQAAVAFENAWRMEEILARKQIEQELSIAAGIQESLFPSVLPALGASDIAARNRQARQVGGDYYDVLPIDRTGPDGRHLLCVADISGKGLPAALLMSNIQATLRATLGSLASLAELAARVNSLLHASTPSNKYATAFFLSYDPATGECAYVNGGHNDGILLRRDGSVTLLATTGLPVGLFARAEYEEGRVLMEAGDLLLLYSDGVTEADDLNEEEFGMDRTIDVMRAHRDEPSAAIVDHMIRAIDAFAGAAPQHDDITLMALKRTE
jgi:sigma-B regulation protein RsbU (phosphoserine phosphatase)